MPLHGGEQSGNPLHGGEQSGNSGIQSGILLLGGGVKRGKVFIHGIVYILVGAVGVGGVKRGEIFGHGIEIGELPEHGGEQPEFGPGIGLKIGMIPEGDGNLGTFPEHGDLSVINGPINL